RRPVAPAGPGTGQRIPGCDAGAGRDPASRGAIPARRSGRAPPDRRAVSARCLRPFAATSACSLQGTPLAEELLEDRDQVPCVAGLDIDSEAPAEIRLPHEQLATRRDGNPAALDGADDADR